MTRQEALKLLNLKEGFTQEALKKAYREESKKVHPDKHPEEFEEYNEKFKEINEANEILSGKRPAEPGGSSYSSNNSCSQSYFDLEQYKKSKYEEIKNMIGKTDNEVLNRELVRLGNLLSFAVSKEIVDRRYQETKDNIHNFYENYKNDWYSKYELSDDMILEEISYNAKFDDFCKQLEIIRNRYSKKYQFQKKLDEATEVYKNYATYNERIANRINTLKEEALLQAKKNGYEDIELIILDVHKKIGEEFTANFELEQKIKRISNEVRELENIELSIMFSNFLFNYREAVDLSIIRKEIAELERKIASIKSPISVKRNKLHSKLMTRFAEVFKNNKANISAEIELNKKYIEVLQLFNDYDEGLIDIETLLQLEDYDFIGPVPIKKDEKIEIIDRFKIFNKEEIDSMVNKLSEEDKKVIKMRFNRN